MRRIADRVLLEPADVLPSRNDVEVIGVLNPAAAEVGSAVDRVGGADAGGGVVLLVRVAERPRERERGWTALPRFDGASGELVLDRFRDDDIEPVDPRVVRVRRSGRIRLTSVSHLRVVRLSAPASIRAGEGRAAAEASGSVVSAGDRPPAEAGGVFLPRGPLEEYGVEDARITRLEGRYWFTYVAVSGRGVATALASTTDFRAFERHGVIFCPENKDVVLFPVRLPGGWFVALHRPAGATPFTAPEIWTARSPDLLSWGWHRPLAGGSGAGVSEVRGLGEWQAGRVGAGPPPIRTRQGWLLIYHGSRPAAGTGRVGAYAAGALLLDEAGERIVGRTPGPVLVPERAWEREGFVPDVVFPTGAVLRGDALQLYYGAADCRCAMVELSLAELLNAME